MHLTVRIRGHFRPHPFSDHNAGKQSPKRTPTTGHQDVPRSSPRTPKTTGRNNAYLERETKSARPEDVKEPAEAALREFYNAERTTETQYDFHATNSA